jgi:hypothetical protein
VTRRFVAALAVFYWWVDAVKGLDDLPTDHRRCFFAAAVLSL